MEISNIFLMRILLFITLFSISLFSKVDIILSHVNVVHGSAFAVILQSTINLGQAPNLIFKNKTYQMFTISGSTKNYEVFIPD